MRKDRCDVRRWKMIINRGMFEKAFLTLYTIQLEWKMRRLMRRAIRARYARQVSDLLKDLPPQDKGAILLAQWAAESQGK
jgi:hypothetical protein